MFVMQDLRREIEDELKDETGEGETVRRLVNLPRFEERDGNQAKDTSAGKR